MPDIVLEKKILVVSSWAPPTLGGSPQQLYNFFSRFSADSYVLYTNRKNANPNRNGKMLPVAHYFFPGKNIMSIIREGKNIIRNEHIGGIYATTDDGKAFGVALLLSLFSNLPLVLHFFDIYKGNYFPFPWNVLSFLVEPLALMRAKAAIFPNQAIFEEYKKRYGHNKKFHCVNNAASAVSYANLRTPYRPHSPYTVVFTGSIYWAQESSVRNLIEAVLSMPTDIRAHFYVPKIPQNLAQQYKDNPRVAFAVAAPDAMPDVQTRADILFIPLAFKTPSSVVTRTALAGKLAEYLISGRPILIQAPEESFTALYGTREGFAEVVTESGATPITQSIERLITDRAYAEKYITRAQETFSKYHDIEKNAPLLARVINSIFH